MWIRQAKSLAPPPRARRGSEHASAGDLPRGWKIPGQRVDESRAAPHLSRRLYPFK
jgi:hypothetical protein